MSGGRILTKTGAFVISGEKILFKIGLFVMFGGRILFQSNIKYQLRTNVLLTFDSFPQNNRNCSPLVPSKSSVVSLGNVAFAKYFFLPIAKVL